MPARVCIAENDSLHLFDFPIMTGTFSRRSSLKCRAWWIRFYTGWPTLRFAANSANCGAIFSTAAAPKQTENITATIAGFYFNNEAYYFIWLFLLFAVSVSHGYTVGRTCRVIACNCPLITWKAEKEGIILLSIWFLLWKLMNQICSCRLNVAPLLTYIFVSLLCRAANRNNFTIVFFCDAFRRFRF